MSTATTPNLGARLALAVAGPAALGVALASRDIGSASEVLRLPVLWIGVAALMTPALYIVAALSGLAPSAREVVGSAVDALGRGGGLVLGLAPALLFLVATSFSGAVARGLVGLAAIVGAVAALGVLFHRLYVEPDAGVSARFVFMGWAAVLLGIGVQLFTLGQA